ncbi:MAG: DsrE/DsrF/TusD sulfur relay family protein [Candidatus Bathyarchaeia archaeon]
MKRNRKTLTIALLRGPYSSDNAELALHLARKTKEKGHTVNVFLYIDGVWNAHSDQNPQNQPNIAQLLNETRQAGVDIKVCVRCGKARGLKEQDILPELPFVMIHQLTQWVAESDKVLTFTD